MEQKEDEKVEKGEKDEKDEKDEKTPPIVKGKKEELYDKIPITKKQLDVIIIILFAALIIFLVVGTLVGNRII